MIGSPTQTHWFFQQRIHSSHTARNVCYPPDHTRPGMSFFGEIDTGEDWVYGMYNHHANFQVIFEVGLLLRSIRDLVVII